MGEPNAMRMAKGSFRASCRHARSRGQPNKAGHSGFDSRPIRPSYGMTPMQTGDEIGKHGLPRDMTSCPACGRLYGHHRTKVCANCEECSKCCSCGEQRLLEEHELEDWLLEHS